MNHFPLGAEVVSDKPITVWYADSGKPTLDVKRAIELPLNSVGRVVVASSCGSTGMYLIESVDRPGFYRWQDGRELCAAPLQRAAMIARAAKGERMLQAAVASGQIK
jgi:hypothetical protein